MGTLLLNDGVISRAQFMQAKELACSEKGITIEEALVKLGFVLQDVVDAYSIMQHLSETGYSKKTNSVIRRILHQVADHTNRYGKRLDNFTSALSQK